MSLGQFTEDRKKKAPNIWIPCNSFSKWLLLPFCGCCPTLHCRALVSHELLICSPALRAQPGSLAVLHAHCATPWSPACAPPDPHTDSLPSMEAGTAMALCSDADPLHIAPFISEPSQLFPSSRCLSHSSTHGVSLLNWVLVIAGPAHFPQLVFCKVANPYLTLPCGVHPHMGKGGPTV